MIFISKSNDFSISHLKTKDFLILDSKMHPTMQTFATVCDGIVECHGGEDEADTCEADTTAIVLVFSAAILVTYFLMKIVYWIFKKKDKDIEWRQDIQFQTLLNIYENNHDVKSVIDDINKYLIHVYSFEKKSTRVRKALQFYSLEEKIHRNNKAKIFACLRSHLDPVNAHFIIQNKFPSFLARHFPRVHELLDRFSRCEWLGNPLLYSVKKIYSFSHFVDLFKDCYLLGSMIVLVGGLGPVLEFYDKFPSVVIIWSAASILFPLLISSLHLGIGPENEMDFIFILDTCRIDIPR